MRRLLAAVSLISVCGLLAAGVGSAAREETVLQCENGQTVTVLTATTGGEADAFGVGQIVGGGGHLIPTGFSGSLVDVDKPELGELFSFSQLKGNGNANRNQATVSCSFGDSGLAADFFGPDPLPEGVDPTDVVAFTFTVSVIWKT